MYEKMTVITTNDHFHWIDWLSMVVWYPMTSVDHFEIQLWFDLYWNVDFKKMRSPVKVIDEENNCN